MRKTVIIALLCLLFCVSLCDLEQEWWDYLAKEHRKEKAIRRRRLQGKKLKGKDGIEGLKRILQNDPASLIALFADPDAAYLVAKGFIESSRLNHAEVECRDSFKDASALASTLVLTALDEKNPKRLVLALNSMIKAERIVNRMKEDPAVRSCLLFDAHPLKRSILKALLFRDELNEGLKTDIEIIAVTMEFLSNVDQKNYEGIGKNIAKFVKQVDKVTVSKSNADLDKVRFSKCVLNLMQNQNSVTEAATTKDWKALLDKSRESCFQDTTN